MGETLLTRTRARQRARGLRPLSFQTDPFAVARTAPTASDSLRGLAPDKKRAWPCTRFRHRPTGRKREGQIKPGDSTAHRRNCLPLLPSGPGGVRQPSVAWVPVLNFALCAQAPTRQAPQKGIRPRISGFRVKGTANSPSSTAKLFLETKESGGERGIRTLEAALRPPTRFPIVLLRPARTSLHLALC